MCKATTLCFNGKGNVLRSVPSLNNIMRRTVWWINLKKVKLNYKLMGSSLSLGTGRKQITTQCHFIAFWSSLYYMIDLSIKQHVHSTYQTKLTIIPKHPKHLLNSYGDGTMIMTSLPVCKKRTR